MDFDEKCYREKFKSGEIPKWLTDQFPKGCPGKAPDCYDTCSHYEPIRYARGE